MSPLWLAGDAPAVFGCVDMLVNNAGIIVHGWMTFAVMCQAVSAWIPLEIADVKSFAVRYLKPNMSGPGIYGGRVVRKSEHGSEREVEMEIWAEAPGGVRLAVGTVVLAFT